MVKNITAGVLGGLILFFWGSFSWMVLPWHKATLHQFVDPIAVSQAVHSNSLGSGMYILPAKMDQAPVVSEKPQPMVFAAVHLEGMPASIGMAVLISLITQIVAALLIVWLLLQTKNLSYWQRLTFVTLFGLTAGIVTDVPYWNWLHFDLHFTLVQMADLVIGWFLAGLVLAKR